MLSLPHLIFSNSLDFLARALIDRIEAESTSPLSPKVIFVPDGTLKPWLLYQLTRLSPKKAIAGLKIVPWQQGLSLFLKNKEALPSFTDLRLLLYVSLQTSEEPEVIQYLNGSKEKLIDLADELAILFSTYGLYGKSLFQQNGKENDWQRRLIVQLFQKSPWKLPIQLLDAKQFSGSLYCYGCNFLPLPLWNLLFQIPKIQIFQFSPCASYWGDLCTPYEKRKEIRYWKQKATSDDKLRELESYLDDFHPLLAHLGKLGRDTQNIFESFEFELSEIYSFFDSNSVLSALQNELLENEKKDRFFSFEKEDRSIRIGLTGPSRYREIQVLRDEILKLHQEGVSFSEMVVLAPHIEIYSPFIELIFSDPEGAIPYRLASIDLLLQSSFWRGIKELLALSSSRWEVDRILKLLENPAIQAKQRWDREKIDRFRSWVNEANIRWGADKNQKERVFSSFGSSFAAPSSRGTWEEGIHRMFNGMIYCYPEEWFDLPNPRPIPSISLADVEDAADFFRWIEQLKFNLTPFQDNSVRKISEWVDLLEVLPENYLEIDEESDRIGKKVWDDILASLKASAIKFEETKVPFAFLAPLFSVSEKNQNETSSLHGVYVSSFQEGSVIPCRALFMIGMSEEQFPRHSVVSSLNLLKSSNELPPLNAECDRYLFLQAICSAKETIVISYGHISSEEGKEVGPSILVQELRNYLKRQHNFEIPTFIHPSFALHHKCFSEPHLQTTSLKAYKASQVHYSLLPHAVDFDAAGEHQNVLSLAASSCAKIEPARYKSSLNFWPIADKLPSLALPQGEKTIYLKELNSLFRNPWKFYFQKIFHFSLGEKEKEDWTEFELNLIQRAQILKSSINHSVDKIIDRFHQRGDFPIGLFGELYQKELTFISKEWKNNLTVLGLQDETIGSFYLRHLPDEPRSYPCIKLEWDGLRVKIVGEIKFSCLKGPLHLSDDSLPALFRSWPEYLAALSATQTNSIFCLRSGEIKRVTAPLEALRRCVELYFLGSETPLPLISDWVDPLLRKGPEELQKKIDYRRTVIEDPIYDWIAARTTFPSAEKIFSIWSEYLRKELSHLIDLFPTKGKKRVDHAAL